MKKVCIKCNVEFPLNTDYFYFMNCKNAFINLCRTCHKQKLTNDRIRREAKARSLGYESEHHFKKLTNKNYVIYRNSEEFKLTTKKSDAIRNKNKINNITDEYIIVLLKARGLKKNQITTELIDICRLNIQLKRAINDSR